MFEKDAFSFYTHLPMFVKRKGNRKQKEKSRYDRNGIFEMWTATNGKTVDEKDGRNGQ